ncbi:MAG TPA: hypothetical protein VN577_11920 [Terriglobales bacterium]|nr:hypothetical protein [Terriglobales bacterium]
MRVFTFPAILVIAALALVAQQQQQTPAASSTQAIYNAQVQSAQKKFDYIIQNGAKAAPDQNPTVLTENEINSWLMSGNAELPKGVRKLQFRGNPGVIDATATVDFDQITAGRRSSHPLLSLFRGTHEVQARASAAGSAGVGQVHIESVSIDGVGVPKFALEFFVDKYIRPKYPNLGMDSTFRLPHKIDIARVGSRKLTVTQKALK